MIKLNEEFIKKDEIEEAKQKFKDNPNNKFRRLVRVELKDESDPDMSFVGYFSNAQRTQMKRLREKFPDDGGEQNCELAVMNAVYPDRHEMAEFSENYYLIMIKAGSELLKNSGLETEGNSKNL